MNLFKDKFYGNLSIDWLIAAGVFLLTFILLTLLKALYIKKFKKRSFNGYNHLIIQLFQRTGFIFIFLFSSYMGLRILQFPRSLQSTLYSAAIIVLMVQVAIWGNEVISFFLNRSVHKRLQTDAASAPVLALIGVIGKISMWAIVLTMVLANLGFNVSSLVAGLGIGGAAVALASQKILGDLFASLSIVLDKPFVYGDTIQVGDLTGTVEYIGMKTTRLRSATGEQIIFSNSDILQSRIRNFKRMGSRPVTFSLGVTYSTPVEKLEKIPALIRSLIEAQPDIRFDRCHFSKYTDSSLNIETVYAVLISDYGQYMDIQQKINLGILKKFQEEGIGFAYPTRTVYLEGKTVS